MLWIRNNARLLICSALALALGLGAGVLIPTGAAAPEQAAETPEPAAQAAAQAGGPSILPDTTVQVDYTFALCGHTVTLDRTEGELTGRNAEGVTALWPGARVLELTGEHAHIRREMAGHCPAHFVLRLTEGGKLTVSNADGENPAEVNVTTLEYDPSGLPGDVLARLRAGVAFDSLEQINAYLEDVES